MAAEAFLVGLRTHLDLNKVDLRRVRFKAFQGLCQVFGFVFVKVNFAQRHVTGHQRKIYGVLLEFMVYCCFSVHGALAEELTCLLRA